MRILLDTCEFLWLVSGDDKLSPKITAAVRDADNEVFLSAVSFWEISLKHSLGKLPLPQPPAEFVPLQREKHWMKPPSPSVGPRRTGGGNNLEQPDASGPETPGRT